MSFDERVRAGQVDSAVRAANAAFGLFEPFRRVLVGKLRRTATRGWTDHECRRISIQGPVRRIAVRCGIIRDDKPAAPQTGPCRGR
jgi:hypothetical protein